MLRHIVIFRYRRTATAAQIAQLIDAFRGLKDRIPAILSFEHGVNSSPEGKDLGFSHVHVLTFSDEGARDAYLQHPDHRQFVAFLDRLQIIDQVFVVDYEPQR